MDLLHGVYEGLDATENLGKDILPPDGEGNVPPLEMPTLEKLLEAVENMEGITEENKRDIKESLLAKGADISQMTGNFGNFMPGVTIQKGGLMDYALLLFLVGLVMLILVFFGYKLYTSLVERERKREEKRRQKQQKKKK